jgi:phosphoglycolate phosphatase
MQVIFDFDGTIVDSFQCVVKHANLLASKFHFRIIKEEEIEVLRNLSSVEIIRYLNIPIHLMPLIVYQMRKAIHRELVSLPPIPGMPDIIKALYRKEIALAILTTNSTRNVKTWLLLNDMQHLFNVIYSDYRVFSKATLLKQIIKNYDTNLANIYYIGDETRDISAANENGIQSIAVTWGYNSEQILAQYQPNYIARRPKDILKFIHLA